MAIDLGKQVYSATHFMKLARLPFHVKNQRKTLTEEIIKSPYCCENSLHLKPNSIPNSAIYKKGNRPTAKPKWEVFHTWLFWFISKCYLFISIPEGCACQTELCWRQWSLSGVLVEGRRVSWTVHMKTLRTVRQGMQILLPNIITMMSLLVIGSKLYTKIVLQSGAHHLLKVFIPSWVECRTTVVTFSLILKKFQNKI